MNAFIYCLWIGLALLLNAPSWAEDATKFLQGKTVHKGFIPFYVDNASAKVYLELSRSNTGQVNGQLLGGQLLGEELLYVSSLPQGLGSNDIGLDRGQLNGSARLVRFEHVGDKVLLRQLNTQFRAQSDNALERRAAEEAFASSIIWGFPVVARDTKRIVVDATAFLLRDSHGIGRRLKRTKQGEHSLDLSRSAVYLPRCKAFPKNTELESSVTFTGSKPGEYLRQVAPDPYSFSVRLHHSFIALPEKGYTPRKFHPGSGFFPFQYHDYASAIDEPLIKRFIPRHRLHKKNPEQAVSEAVKPIVYYLDPGTPEPIRGALLEGARWWDSAFNAIGFKNAFQVKMLPANADPMDVRYNVIQWVHRATRGWSYGSSIIDPRTGEIIKGLVTLGSLRVRQDYLIAQGMTAPFDSPTPSKNAPKVNTIAAMALDRIRQLSAHEVGHTLGLAHNFAASTTQRASVMDYPHPFIHIEADGEISLNKAYTSGIGQWDKHTIAYGYQAFGDPLNEKQALQQHVDNARAKGLLYISDPDARRIENMHPRAHLWENGADAVVELERIIALRAKALDNFDSSAIRYGDTYSSLEEVLVPVYYYHRFQIEAVGKWIGGVDYDYAIRQPGEKFNLRPVTADKQLQAMNGLLKTLSPDFLMLSKEIRQLIPPKAYGYQRTRESSGGFTGAMLDPVSMAESSANATLAVLMHPHRLARLRIQAAENVDQLSTQALFSRLQKLVTQQYQGLAAEIHQRVAARVVQHWLQLLVNAEVASEVKADVFAAVDNLKSWLSKRKKRSSHNSRYQPFYAWQLQLINHALKNHQPGMVPSAQKMPPGSPI